MSTSLRFKGDWGAFNLTRICGWMAWEYGRRSGDLLHTIVTGRGMADNLFALGRGEVDIAVATPAGFARMARQGLGPFEGEAFPELCALGVLPHRDGLLVALRAELGITSFAQLREQRPALSIVAAPDDGESFMGLGAASVLGASGIEPQEIVDWGGRFIHGEDPSECLELFASEHADAVIQEAMMTPWWNDLAEDVDLRFLSLERSAVDRLRSSLAIEPLAIEAGYLRGMEDSVIAADFSGWLVATRRDLPDEIAQGLAAVLLETNDFFEAQYRHIPQRYSPLSYPIEARELVQTPIPLHAAAQAQYEAQGALGPASGS